MVLNCCIIILTGCSPSMHAHVVGFDVVGEVPVWVGSPKGGSPEGMEPKGVPEPQENPKVQETPGTKTIVY